MPIKNVFPFLFCLIAGIASFLFLLALFSHAPYISLERRHVLVEQLTPEEEKFYNNASPEDIEVHVQEKFRQINHTPLPGWFYKSRQINGQNHIEAFRRDKFAPNEIMGFLLSTAVLPILYLASLTGLIFLLCLLTFKYNKTLFVLSSRLSHPIHNLPSPVWESLLLAIPPINLVWIWPSSLRAVYYGKKLSRLCKIPYKGPSRKLARTTSLLLPSLTLFFNLVISQLFPFNIILQLPGLVFLYLYIKRLNVFIVDISKEAGSTSSIQLGNRDTGVMNRNY